MDDRFENILPTQDALIQHTKEQYIKEYIFGMEHLCHNMMYPVLLHGDGREKKMNHGFQFGQLLQGHPNHAKNWLNAAAKNLVDLHADVVKPCCLVTNCVCSGTCFKD